MNLSIGHSLPAVLACGDDSDSNARQENEARLVRRMQTSTLR